MRLRVTSVQRSLMLFELKVVKLEGPFKTEVALAQAPTIPTSVSISLG